jgi:hypothetical protein
VGTAVGVNEYDPKLRPLIVTDVPALVPPFTGPIKLTVGASKVIRLILVPTSTDTDTDVNRSVIVDGAAAPHSTVVPDDHVAVAHRLPPIATVAVND